MIVFWKTYKQNPWATAMSAMGATAIAFGLILTPITVLIFQDMDYQHFAQWAFLGLQAVSLLGGVLLMLHAPKRAKRDMDRRITEDVEYARYIVHIYPEMKEYVRNLQPAYYEDSSRPIKDFSKPVQRQVPLWRKVFAALLAVVLLFVVIYILRIYS